MTRCAMGRMARTIRHLNFSGARFSVQVEMTSRKSCLRKSCDEPRGAFGGRFPSCTRPSNVRTSVLGTGSADTGLIIVLFSSSIGRGSHEESCLGYRRGIGHRKGGPNQPSEGYCVGLLGHSQDDLDATMLEISQAMAMLTS